MSDLVLAASLPVPQPREAITIRVATMSDMEFIDGLQKKHSDNLGFLPFKALEGKIVADQILIAESNGKSIGYCIGQDRYYKRDDLGIIYQMNIVPGKQRGFVATALLKAQFDRSAYGCRLYCCWCAQDLEANHFWEAMGFVPLAFRAGSEKKARVHIFWQKKIRGNDDTCHWWYPHKTDQGAMRADRLAFPIPPGTHWMEVKAVVMPREEAPTLALPPGTGRGNKKAPPKIQTPTAQAQQFGRPGVIHPLPQVVVPKLEIEKPKPVRTKAKIDPKLVSASRELRDRYLEQVNERGYQLESHGKYELTRAIATSGARAEPLRLAA